MDLANDLCDLFDLTLNLNKPEVLNTKTAVKYLLNIQEERASLYNKFQNYFKKYILIEPASLLSSSLDSSSVSDNDANLKKLSENFNKFRLICNQITQLFNVLSIEIRAVKNLQLSPRLCGLIESLQNYEQNKFKLTIEYYLTEYEHLTKQNEVDYDQYVQIGKLNSLKRELNKTVEQINDCIDEIRYEQNNDENEDINEFK